MVNAFSSFFFHERKIIAYVSYMDRVNLSVATSAIMNLEGMKSILVLFSPVSLQDMR
jgi:hypothetical protein